MLQLISQQKVGNYPISLLTYYSRISRDLICHLCIILDYQTRAYFQYILEVMFIEDFTNEDFLRNLLLSMHSSRESSILDKVAYKHFCYNFNAFNDLCNVQTVRSM